MTDQDNQNPKEESRKIALINLKDKGMQALATAGFVENSTVEGENDKIAVDQFKYFPAMTSPSKQIGQLVYGGLLGSRQGGKRYSGNLSEIGMIQKASGIYAGSLGAIKVGDLMKLAGSKKDVPEDKDKYVSDLEKADREEILGMYMARFTGTQVAEARSAMADEALKGLEETVLNPSNGSE